MHTGISHYADDFMQVWLYVGRGGQAVRFGLVHMAEFEHELVVAVLPSVQTAWHDASYHHTFRLIVFMQAIIAKRTSIISRTCS